MSTLRSLRAVARMALQVPGGLRYRGCAAVADLAPDNERCPVVLVHGYGGTEAVWSSVRPALTEAGFGHVIGLRYGSVTTHPGAVAAELARLALDAVAVSGAPGVHLVGHSLGGLIVRQAVETHPDLAAVVLDAVTIGTPHSGIPLARMAPGTCARLMHRRDPVSGTRRPVPRVRWLAYYSDRDRVVPPLAARLDDPRHQAQNHLIPGCGHMTICHDARLVRSLVAELLAAEIGLPAVLGTRPVEVGAPRAPRPSSSATARTSIPAPRGGGTVPDPHEFRTTMSAFATGVTVVTTTSPAGEPYGMTVNSFTSVSLDPLLVLVCLRSDSRGLECIRESGVFAVNVLGEDQRALSQWFADRRRPGDSSMFDGVATVRGRTGCPVLLRAAASFDCRLHGLQVAGDHVIVTGSVVALTHRPEVRPLLFHGGGYHRLATERPAPSALARPGLRVISD